MRNYRFYRQEAGRRLWARMKADLPALVASIHPELREDHGRDQVARQALMRAGACAWSTAQTARLSPSQNGDSGNLCCAGSRPYAGVVVGDHGVEHPVGWHC